MMTSPARRDDFHPRRCPATQRPRDRWKAKSRPCQI
jgi:hypothetical protein